MVMTIENYCIECKAVAQPDCNARGHIVGTLGQDSGASPVRKFERIVGELDYGSYRAEVEQSSEATRELDASAEEQHELEELSTGFVDVAVTFSGIWKQPGFSNKDRDALVERLAAKVREVVEDEIDGEFTRLETESQEREQRL